jgi:acyl carrier protein
MMHTISSRTPEGFPSNCPFCGTELQLEFSLQGHDATCPRCGTLVWQGAQLLAWLRDQLSRMGITAIELTPETRLTDLGMDSLGLVELTMEMQAEFVMLENSDEWQTIGDLLRSLQLRTND